MPQVYLECGHLVTYYVYYIVFAVITSVVYVLHSLIVYSLLMLKKFSCQLIFKVKRSVAAVWLSGSDVSPHLG